MEPRKQNIVIVAGLVLLALLAGAYFWFSQINQSETGNEESGKQIVPTSPTSLTRTDAPPDVKVPEKGEETSKDVAAPEVVAPSRPGAESKFRVFAIEGRGNKFMPSEVIVNKGDIVHINFKAVDKTYDFFIPDYGLKAVAQAGETKVIEFGANTAGRYTYYCELCGGLNSSAKGYITIK